MPSMPNRFPNPQLQPSTPPLNLAGHTCVYFDGNMYVFGGCNDDDSFSEVFELELEWEWCKYPP